MMKRRHWYTFIPLLGIVLLCTNCVYNNEEVLYPAPPQPVEPVDTCGLPVVVSYADDIVPILDANVCLACHENADPAGGIGLEGYDRVLPFVEDGSLLGSIQYDPQFSRMPKGNYDKVPDCEISMIKKWIDQGYPNN